MAFQMERNTKLDLKPEDGLGASHPHPMQGMLVYRSLYILRRMHTIVMVGDEGLEPSTR